MRIISVLSVPGALLLLAGSAAAQLNDHLRCYKTKDPHKYTANVALATNAEQAVAFPGATGCKVIVKSKEFCVPVEKTRTLDPGNPRDAPQAAVEGNGLGNDFLCYKVRCDTTAPLSQLIVDQFGTRSFEGFKTSRICTPAEKTGAGPFKGPAPFPAVVSQAVRSGSPIEVDVLYFTSIEPEFRFRSIEPVSSPAGITVSATENLGRRNCPGGVPMLGAQAFGCEQYWLLRLTLAPGVCELDGTYEFEFDYGCNEAMPHCDFVDPTQPDELLSLMLSSDSLCGP